MLADWGFYRWDNVYRFMPTTHNYANWSLAGPWSIWSPSQGTAVIPTGSCSLCTHPCILFYFIWPWYFKLGLKILIPNCLTVFFVNYKSLSPLQSVFTQRLLGKHANLLIAGPYQRIDWLSSYSTCSKIRRHVLWSNNGYRTMIDLHLIARKCGRN